MKPQWLARLIKPEGSKDEWIQATIVGLAVAVVTFIISLSTDITDYYALLASSVIALIGVIITGYIFLSESIRRIREENPTFASTATDVQRDIIRHLKTVFVIGILAIVVYITTMSVFGSDSAMADWRRFFRAFFIGTFVVILCISLRLSLRMMDIYDTIEKKADENIGFNRNLFREKPLIVSLNPKEMKDLSDRGLCEPMERDAPMKKACAFEYNKDEKFIWFIKGSNRRIFYVKAGAPEPTDDTGSRYMSATECKDLPLNGYRVNDAILETRRDMRDEFDPHDVLAVFASIEKILCKIANVDRDNLSDMDRKTVESALNSGMVDRMEYDLGDEIVDTYYKLRKYRDSLLITGKTGNEDLEIMTPWVFLLKFEVSQKMDGRNLCDMSLGGIDLSFADMTGSSLRDGNYSKTTLYQAILDSADFSGCNMDGTDMRGTRCNGTVFKSAVMNDVSFMDANLRNSIFSECRATNMLIPNVTVSGSVFSKATLSRCLLKKSHFENSDFKHAIFLESVLTGCVLTNNDFRLASLSGCIVEKCDFTGSNISSAIINNSTIQTSQFANSKIESCEMTSLFIRDCKFPDSVASDINFTGSQMLGVSFESSKVSNSNFTGVLISSYKLKRRDAKWIVKDLDVLNTYEQVALGIIRPDEKERSGSDRQFTDLTDLKNSVSCFDHAFMMNCMFVEAELVDSTFRCTILSCAIMNKVRISNCTFENATLSRAMASDTVFDGCNLNKTSLDNANFTNVTFRDCSFNDASMSDTGFVGVRFEQCKLSETFLKKAKVVGCTFVGIHDVDGLTLDAERCTNISFEDCRLSNGERFDRKGDGVESVREWTA